MEKHLKREKNRWHLSSRVIRSLSERVCNEWFRSMRGWFQLRNLSREEKAAAGVSKWMAIIVWDECSSPAHRDSIVCKHWLENMSANGRQPLLEGYSNYRVCEFSPWHWPYFEWVMIFSGSQPWELSLSWPHCDKIIRVRFVIALYLGKPEKIKNEKLCNA